MSGAARARPVPVSPRRERRRRAQMRELPDSTRHVILLSAIPMVYPSLGVVEKLLKFFSGSKPTALLGKTGAHIRQGARATATVQPPGLSAAVHDRSRNLGGSGAHLSVLSRPARIARSKLAQRGVADAARAPLQACTTRCTTRSGSRTCSTT